MTNAVGDLDMRWKETSLKIVAGPYTDFRPGQTIAIASKRGRKYIWHVTEAMEALDTWLDSRGCSETSIWRRARLLCPLERAHEFSGWDTAYVHDTVVALGPDAGATALGSAFGTREQINARAWESVRACDELRSAINGVDHAPTELVLTRQCADVSKLMYHMRINGDILDLTCSHRSTGNSAPLSATPCVVTFRTTLGGRPPPV